MKGVRGFVAGVIGLSALELLTQSADESKVTGLLGFPAAAARWLIDPTVPLVPDIAHADGGPQAPVGTMSATTMSSISPLPAQPIRTVPKYAAPPPQVAPPAANNTPIRIH